MNTAKAKNLYEKFAPCVAYVEVLDDNGDPQIGSAYHIGEGIFITAKHVVEGLRINRIATTVPVRNKELSEIFQPHKDNVITMIKEPVYHPDNDIDVACIITDAKHLSHIPLGTHLDSFLDTEMILHSTLILGYPPVPFDKRPTLIASLAQVNAIINKYVGKHPHFIISATARGGFSGGPCLHENGFAIGVITESLTQANLPTELGYLSVISIEPVYTCLRHHGIMPKIVEENLLL